jgi:hypothetical protein
MTKERDYVFWFHYNKPATAKAGKPQITVHYRNKCHIVDNLVCNVPTRGHLKKDQPRFVIKGAVPESKFVIKEGVAYLG